MRIVLISALLHALTDFFYALSPHASSQAQAIHSIFTKFLILAGIIFLLVTTLVIVAIIRFRAKNGDGEPKQVFGNRRLEPACLIYLTGVVIKLTQWYTAPEAADYHPVSMKEKVTP